MLQVLDPVWHFGSDSD